MALINQKQIRKRNKTKNTSTEILRDLQTEDHSLWPSTLDVISKSEVLDWSYESTSVEASNDRENKESTQRKRVNFVKNENTQCKCMKISDEMNVKNVKMSKKQANLLAKIKLLIGERMEMLNNDLNQKLDILNQRFEQIQQCTKQCEEIAKTLLKKASKLETYINAAIAFQQQLSSRMAFCQPMFPRADYQNTVLSQLGPSAFYPNAIMPRICNVFLLPPYTGFPSVHVPQYTGSDEVTLISMETPNTAAANNPGYIRPVDYHQQRVPRRYTEDRTSAVSSSSVLHNAFQTSKQFPHLPPLPRIPLCLESVEGPKDPPQNPEINCGLCAKSKGVCCVINSQRI